MDKKDFDRLVKDTLVELERLADIVNQPERIMSDFYDAYKPNLLQRTLEFQGYTEGELYEVLIAQISKLPALANCKITRVSNEPLAPIRICYRDPMFELFILDIKGKKYEYVYDTVRKGIDYRIQDAEDLQHEAEENVKTLRHIEARILTIVAGEIPLKKMSLSKRASLKQYMKTLSYSDDDIRAACDKTGAFLEAIAESLAKRQSVLAEARKELSECQNQKEGIENNPYLQNAVKDLTELLQNSGYTSKTNISAPL